MSLNADVEISVAQHETDKYYAGEISISVANQSVSNFLFEWFNPNDSRTFKMILYRDDVEILSHFGGESSKSQLDQYTERQVCIFAVLFRLMFVAVKECQRVYGGTTVMSPIQERVEEAIRFVGTEPLASIRFSRRFTWVDKDMFDFFCKAVDV